MRNKQQKITVIGNAVVDVLAEPVSPEVFRKGSCPVRKIKLSYGGDALNEAVLLSRFGKQTELLTKVGQDEAGQRILAFLAQNRVETGRVITDGEIDTSISIVLVDGAGERCFLSDPRGSQRRLTAEDLLPLLDGAADIVSFASIFVSTAMDIPDMERVFRAVKRRPGRVLAADLTKAKRGETLADLKALLPSVDYLFPNEEEAALLTGDRDPERNAALFVEAGVGCAAVKRGSAGCILRTAEGTWEIPACPVSHCADTTGAGDSFAAGFLWAISEGYSPEDCGRFACAAASCAVEAVGATDGILSLEEPMRRFRQMKERAVR